MLNSKFIYLGHLSTWVHMTFQTANYRSLIASVLASRQRHKVQLEKDVPIPNTVGRKEKVNLFTLNWVQTIKSDRITVI